MDFKGLVLCGLTCEQKLGNRLLGMRTNDRGNQDRDRLKRDRMRKRQMEATISAVESLKGSNAIQRCSIENQKGAIDVQSLWR